MDEAIFFKESDETIYIRAQGHVTASLCPELKSKAFARLALKPSVQAVYFDLSTCEYMDSTFLGLIVGINKRFKASGGKDGHPLGRESDLHGSPKKPSGSCAWSRYRRRTRASPNPWSALASGLGPRPNSSSTLTRN